MTSQLSTAVRNARADAIESTIGTSPILEIWSGTKPSDCSSADAGDGSVLATLNLDSDWLAAATGGTKSKSGTWEDLSADANGTATHFRIKDSGGSTCHWQGTVTVTGGGGDMEVDNTSIALGQQITVTTFTWTEGNG